MALVACHECGKEVSTEAHACPRCGAPIKADRSRTKVSARIEIKNPQLWLLVVIAGVVIWILTMDGSPLTPPEQSIVQSSDAGTSYKILEQWSIPNGGFVRVIVTNVNPTEPELRALGEKLRQDTKDERNAVVYVYDDEHAGRDARAAFSEQLSKTDLQHHDRHRVGTYWRNANTGLHEFDMTPAGLGGPNAKVGY